MRLNSASSPSCSYRPGQHKREAKVILLLDNCSNFPETEQIILEWFGRSAVHKAKAMSVFYHRNIVTYPANCASKVKLPAFLKLCLPNPFWAGHMSSVSGLEMQAISLESTEWTTKSKKPVRNLTCTVYQSLNQLTNRDNWNCFTMPVACRIPAILLIG